MLISFEAIHLSISLAVLAVALIGLWVRGKSLSYLFFCAVFGIYLIGVVSLVLFPIHIPEGRMQFHWEVQMNLVLFQFGRCDFLSLCIRNMYENILLSLPFGFGIHFLFKVKRRNILGLAVAVGLVFELVQLIVSLIVRSPFRVVDINDVLLNAIGVLFGYGIFRIFGWLYLCSTKRYKINNKYLFAYIYDVARQSTDS